MFRKIRKGDVIICSELSRLSRAMFSMLSTLEKCDNGGVEVIAIKERFALIEDEFSRYLAPIFAIAGEIERVRGAQRTTEALVRLKSEGIKLGRPVGSKSKNKKLTGKENIILQMRKEKMPWTEIAKKLKVSERTLYYFVTKNDFFR